MKSLILNHSLFPVLAAGLMALPLTATAQDAGGPRPEGPPPTREAPQPERLHAAKQQVRELHAAGKHDEANALAKRLREAMKDRPEVTPPGHADQAAPGRPNPQGNRPQAQVRPMSPPNAVGPQNRMMWRPNAQGGAQTPKVMPWPQPQAAKPQGRQGKDAGGKDAPVAKIRHLRVAAEHLAAAGYADGAAKTRHEIGRLEAELKQAKPQATGPRQMNPQRQMGKQPQMGQRQMGQRQMGQRQMGQACPQARADKDRPQQAGRRPEANRRPEIQKAPDTNAVLLGELRKLHQQMETLGQRLQKLEAGR